MEYYNLYGKNALVVRVDDDRTAEFTAKIPLQKNVNTFESRANTLKQMNEREPVYTLENLQVFFPEMKKIKATAYNKAVKDIQEYNSAQKALKLELSSMSVEDMEKYIRVFPLEHKKLISYEGLNKIEMMVQTAVLGSSSTTAEMTPDKYRKMVEQVYSLLKSAEKSGSAKIIKRILKMGEKFNPASLGMITAPREVIEETEESEVIEEVQP
tara:strand:+ start:208 stop:843 length:636 start_codon:yes stop_codon:yes gene_type:complete